MPWSKEAALARIREVGLVPIVRTPSADEALAAAEGLVSGGIGIVEITMSVPNAIGVIERIAQHYGDDVLLGAGTVLDPDTCRAAISAGAEFIVTPAVEPRVIEVARGAGKVCIPGALTPTEVLTAWQAGADLVKIFPCGPVGGADYIRALKGPFPQIEFVPTGGITLDTIPEFIQAGVAAVGVGSELIDAQALRAGKLYVIRADAQEFLKAIRSARRLPAK